MARALVADRVNDFGSMVLEAVRVCDPHDAGHLERHSRPLRLLERLRWLDRRACAQNHQDDWNHPNKALTAKEMKTRHRATHLIRAVEIARGSGSVPQRNDRPRLD